MRGTIRKIIKPSFANEPEKAEIKVQADDLYQGIRVENVLTDEKGEKVQLKEGAEVDVVIEADPNATKKPA